MAIGFRAKAIAARRKTYRTVRTLVQAKGKAPESTAGCRSRFQAPLPFAGGLWGEACFGW